MMPTVQTARDRIVIATIALAALAVVAVASGNVLAEFAGTFGRLIQQIAIMLGAGKTLAQIAGILGEAAAKIAKIFFF